MTGILSEDAISRLKKLIAVISPSMQEDNMLNHLKKEWMTVVPEGDVKTDSMGNLEFSVIRNADYPTVALVAHTDTICVQITQCIGAGKYRFRSVGASPNMLLGQSVTLINEDGETFPGVVGFDATSQYGQPKGLIFEDLWIDLIGAKDTSSVSAGDLAVLTPRIEISDDIISGSALDDRIGLFIMGEVLRRYVSEGKDYPVNLICAGTVQEEVGLRGSALLSLPNDTSAVIVLDVDYATDIPTPHEDQMGQLHLHNGPGIHRKADNSPRLRKLIKTVATEKGLPIQTSLGRFLYGGTDATPIQVARNGSGNQVCNITIPCRYMHSPIETVSSRDVASAIEIILGIIKKIAV